MLRYQTGSWPAHPGEEERMKALLALDVLDTTPEAHFDGIVQIGKCARSLGKYLHAKPHTPD